MRPIFKRTFPSAIRSRFTKSRTTRYGTGSQRLPDDKPSGLASSAMGGARKHKTWYSGGRSGIRDDDTLAGGSEEEMVPIGKIGVRHDLEWEEAGGARDDVGRGPAGEAY